MGIYLILPVSNVSRLDASERRVNLLSAIGFKLIEHKALLNAATVLIAFVSKKRVTTFAKKNRLAAGV